MNVTPLLIAASCASTWLMVGVIWMVQLVHYPMFAMVDRAGFGAFHRFHGNRITWIVLPAMSTELVSAAILAWRLGSLVTFIGLGCAVVAWLATALLAVPQHNRLANGFEVVAHRRLVATNWFRTAAFTAHGIVTLLVMAGVEG